MSCTGLRSMAQFAAVLVTRKVRLAPSDAWEAIVCVLCLLVAFYALVPLIFALRNLDLRDAIASLWRFLGRMFPRAAKYLLSRRPEKRRRFEPPSLWTRELQRRLGGSP